MVRGVHLGRAILLLLQSFIHFIGIGENFALRKPAIQSTIYYGAVASRAVDGNSNRYYSGSSCSHTLTDKPTPWWRVDLQQRIAVTHVKIANRADNLGKRLCGFEIRIGDSLENNGITSPRCGARQHIPSNQVKNVNYKLTLFEKCQVSFAGNPLLVCFCEHYIIIIIIKLESQNVPFHYLVYVPKYYVKNCSL